jgi:hypothetical protein
MIIGSSGAEGKQGALTHSSFQIVDRVLSEGSTPCLTLQMENNAPG